MAVTYGFYNALNHDRLYDAIQMSSIFDGIIRDGIFSTIGDTMIVTAPEDGMYVNVGSGRAWFNHTWTLNDTDYPIEAEQAEVVLDRIDAVILEVNSSAEVRANSIKFLKGTPSSNPVKPTLTHNAEVNQYALAYVRIKAGQTTIFQSDIENAVGTDETPFITGVLQQVSIETLLKQWEAEFNTYFTNFKDTSTTEFNNWFAAKISEYTAWFAQMQTNMDSNFNEFDAWFQNIKDQLDQDQAGHLQLQIDALEAEMPFIGGSKININFEYDVDPNVQYSNEHYKLTVGDTVRENNFSSSKLHFDEYGILTVGDGVLEVTYDVTDSRTGKVTHASYTYTINMPYFGRFAYNVTISASLYNYQGWLESIGKDPSQYLTIEDVFADEKLLRELMTRHASVDYLVEWLANNNEDAHTVLNNDYCAKWINLRDYALDKLYANPTVKAVMDEVDKYGYGEWALVGQVPKMTSNTAPYGECSGSSVYSGRDYYYAFNEDIDEWLSNSSSVGQYVQYTFTKPIRISGFKIKHRAYRFTSAISFKIQGYNGANWEDISEEFNIPSMDNTMRTFDGKVNATKDYQSYRVYYTSSIFSSDNSFYHVDLVQFLAWQPKGNVPVMTSNTAPYGEVIADSVYSTSYAYNVFDDNYSTNWTSSKTGSSNIGAYIGYKFVNPICLKHIKWRSTDLSSYNVTNVKIKIQGSNDGFASDVHDLTTIDIATWQSNYVYNYDISDNNDYYTSYRLYYVNATHTTTYVGWISLLQFYGRQLNISVPKMTSNTAPWGEASASDTSVAPYKVFNGIENSESDGYQPSSAGAKWLSYDFLNSVCATMGYIVVRNNSSSMQNMDIYIEGSNNKTTWESLCDDITIAPTPIGTRIYFNFNASKKRFRYYRLHTRDGNYLGNDGLKYVQIYGINFFGLDYSEREFGEGSTMKYLYDHGVELETLEIMTSSTGAIAEKRGDCIFLKSYNGTAAGQLFVSNQVNMKDYLLDRVAIGNEFVGNSSNIAVTTQKSTDYVAESYNNFTGLPYNNYLDVSSINSEKYLVITSSRTDGNTVSINEWWLE